MKTRLILMLLLFTGFLCCTSPEKPLSDTDKYLIKSDVKKVINTIIKGCEEVNFEMATAPFEDSPDFRYITNGTISTYKEFISGMKPTFELFSNQKVTLFSENFSFPDNSTVLYTSSARREMNFKDGNSIIAEPMAWFLLFKKIDKKWKVIYGVESYFEKNVEAKVL
jgi:hypothetical protein